MAFDWKGPLRVLAPTIATALGGPMAGAAVAMLSNKLLGKPNGTQDEIAAAVATASPDMFLKLKEAEYQFKKDMADLGVQIEKLNVEDRSSARNRQVVMRDWTPNVLGTVVITMLAIMLYMLTNHVIPVENKDAFNITLGILGGAVLQVMNFFFGSSRGSQSKDEILGDIAKMP